MRTTTTFLLLLITGVLSLFIVRMDRSPHAPPPGSEEAAALYTFKTADADRIEIAGKTQSLSLKKHDGQWWLTEPLQDRANPDYAEALLHDVTAMSSVETLDHDALGKDGWKRAGLNGSAITLEIFRGAQKLASCRIGAHTPVDGTLYLTLPGRDPDNLARVVRIPVPAAETTDASGTKTPAQKDLSALLQAPATDWRDPLLIRVAADSVRRITFSAGTGLMEFKRLKDGPWELVKPLNARADNERVNGVLNRLLNLEARPAIQEKATDATAPVPAMQVSLDLRGGQKNIEMSLEPGATGSADIQATLSDRPGAFATSARAAEIWKLQPNDLRDQHLAHMNAHTVEAIRLRSHVNPEVVLDRKGETWLLTRFGKQLPANQERVNQLFNDMNAASILEFTTDAPTGPEAYGLNMPVLELEWRNEGETESSVLQFGQDAAGGLFAKYASEPFVYRVDWALPGLLPTQVQRWQGLGVLSFSTLVAHRIVISNGTAPPMALLYDPMTGIWSGAISGKDVSANIEINKANALLNMLANFKADTWVTNRTRGYELLKNPCLTVQLLLADPSQPDAPPLPRTLFFAPAGSQEAMHSPGERPRTAMEASASFYGRLDSEPDLFLINRDTFDALITPVLRESGTP